MLTRMNLNATVSVALLHAAVLVQSDEEPGRLPGQLQMLGAVQTTHDQRVLRGRALELQLQLRQEDFSFGPRRPLLRMRGEQIKKQPLQEHLTR